MLRIFFLLFSDLFILELFPDGGGPQGVVQGPAQVLRQREEARRARALVHLQGQVHHCPRRLAQGPGHTQELDQTVVRPQAGSPPHIQKSKNQSKFIYCVTQISK